MENEIVISVKNLSIVFNNNYNISQTLLRDFNHDFIRNKIYFIIGNSNSGKTTLVSHFNGLLHSKFGEIKVNDFLISDKTKKIKNIKNLRKMIGMVFQFPECQLFKETVEKDIMFGPMNFNKKKDEAKKIANKYLTQLEMSPEVFMQRSPFALSGGQKRRVAIAGILAIEPEIMVFDEPTAGLDPGGEQSMLEIISNLKKNGKTVIVITHSMSQVLQLADEVILLGQQKKLFCGDVYELFSNNSLLEENSIVKPEIIKFIDLLILEDEKFKKLYSMKPRTIEELVSCIISIKEGGKNG